MSQTVSISVGFCKDMVGVGAPVKGNVLKNWNKLQLFPIYIPGMMVK